MSHFTVMVFGDDPERQLAPFQENNMGDCPEEYMEFMDCTDEVKEEWENGNTERMFNAAGEHFAPWDPDVHDYIDNKRVPKEGYVEKTVPFKEMYANIDQFAEDWFGYQKEDDEYGYWCNPNSKWDWYLLGGRWRGYFKVKSIGQLKLNMPLLEGPVAGLVPNELRVLVRLYESDPDRFEEVVSKYNGYENEIKKAVIQLVQGSKGDVLEDIFPDTVVVGEPGVFGNDAEPGHADQLLKKYIDYKGMEEEAGTKAAAHWDKVMKLIPGGKAKWKPWSAIEEICAGEAGGKDKVNWKDVRERYWKQSELKDLEKAMQNDGMMLWEPDQYLTSRKNYIQSAKESALTPHAFIKDGEWIEQGQMGWFGTVIDEKPKNDWNKEFTKMFHDLPDDTLVSVYDCHV